MTASFEIGPIRPPSEARSLLLRVVRNCPWNQCAFCHTYKGEKFSLRSAAEVKGDIDAMKAVADEVGQLSFSLGQGGTVSPQVLRMIWDDSQRFGPAHHTVAGWSFACGAAQVFLQDADALIARTPDLLEILRYLKETFPTVKRITTYGRARTVAKKTIGELRELAEAGLSRIHIGMESGDEPLLAHVRKGVTKAEQIRAGRNVVASGISLCEYVMPGLGGRRFARDHALETARTLNQIDPHFIRLRTLYLRRDMPLFEEFASGDFLPLTDDETVAEIRLFVETLEGIQSTIVSDHILNLLEEVQGKLPEEKEKMIAVMDRYLGLPEEERLRFRLGRRLGSLRSLDDLAEPWIRSRIDRALAEVGRADPGGSAKGLEEAIYSLMENYI